MNLTLLPSSKVVTQFVVTIVGLVVVALSNDASWLDGLPVWARAAAWAALGAVAAYFKTETRPTR